MGSRSIKGALACALSLTLLAGGTAHAGPSLERRARVAVRYLVRQQAPDGSFQYFGSTIDPTANGVLSMVAARRGPRAIDKALDYLAANIGEVTSVGEMARVALAAKAGGRNPRAFGGRNLIAEIRATQSDSERLRRDTTVFQRALSVLGRAGGGIRPVEPALWLADAQCRDGGWQFDRPASKSENRHCFTGEEADAFTRSDTNTTAMAVQALQTTRRVEDLSRSPLAFFREIRDPEKRGWGYSWNTRLTDANSTGLVLEAYAARGVDPPRGSRRALRALQYRLCGETGGAFAYTWVANSTGGYAKTDPDLGATVEAIRGLLGRALPIEAVEVTKAPPPVEPC